MPTIDSSIVEKIDDIYMSSSIYKALFITSSKALSEVYTLLSQKDYPVCVLENAYDFNADLQRILILTRSQYESSKDDIDTQNIDHVIYIDEKPENIILKKKSNHIFL